jgi:murein DD-endopeptidase MepM/ murein hydrolase activator NlpD
VLATAKRIQNGKLNLAPGFTGTIKLSSPLPGNPDVTSGYGYRGGGAGVAGFHAGVDLASPQGTPIHAMVGGTVAFAGPYGTGGNTVIIKDVQGRLWFYHHMENQPIVSTGEKVAPGSQLGNVGMTGDATGPHLHIGLYVGGQLVNDTATGGSFANPTGVIQRAFKVGWDKTGSANLSGLDLASPANGGPDFGGGPVVGGAASTTTAQAMAAGKYAPALANVPVPVPANLAAATRTPGNNGQTGTQPLSPAQLAAEEAAQHVAQSGTTSPEFQALMSRAGMIAATAANAPGRTA